MRRWCLLNYGPKLRAPRLSHRKIPHGNLVARARALLVNGGLLTAAVEDEEQIRDMVELPKVSREQLEARRNGNRSAGPPDVPHGSVNSRIK